MKYFYILTLFTAISACGGSEGSNDAAPTTTFITNSGTRGISFNAATYDAALDTFTVQNGVDTYVVSGNSTFDIGTFDAAVDTTSGNGLFVSETDDSFAQLAYISGEGAGTRFSRLSTTLAPQSGSATLTGDYVALLVNNTSGDVFLILSGDASMDFDFGANTTQGMITNRVARSAEDNTVFGGVSVGDLTLTETPLTNEIGIYGGSTTGGSIDLSSLMGSPTTTGGSYSVFIAGNTADEAVGGTGVTHTPIGGGDTYRETGIMALGH